MIYPLFLEFFSQFVGENGSEMSYMFSMQLAPIFLIIVFSHYFRFRYAMSTGYIGRHSI